MLQESFLLGKKANRVDKLQQNIVEIVSKVSFVRVWSVPWFLINAEFVNQIEEEVRYLIWLWWKKVKTWYIAMKYEYYIMILQSIWYVYLIKIKYSICRKTVIKEGRRKLWSWGSTFRPAPNGPSPNWMGSHGTESWRSIWDMWTWPDMRAQQRWRQTWKMC